MRAMLAEMTASELAGWSAFYSLEPWGFDAENRRAAVVASTVANTAGKKVRRPTKIEDFLPRETSAPSVVDKVKAIFGYDPRRGKG